ncbi:hypothetical protein IE4771_CH03019 [Rhizobium etli bv. mimosae str. IE4771]|uniref:Uncharacterized protein n=1 Tax=Rhizobium etli bv. mimosae str. IE4771 TaxID=1432050 RepID=A0A060HYX6_RHIET|nr:hypothetical protein IE4771_CH03019 [Rhizobium sp. IE4771]
MQAGLGSDAAIEAAVVLDPEIAVVKRRAYDLIERSKPLTRVRVKGPTVADKTTYRHSRAILEV